MLKSGSQGFPHIWLSYVALGPSKSLAALDLYVLVSEMGAMLASVPQCWGEGEMEELAHQGGQDQGVPDLWSYVVSNWVKGPCHQDAGAHSCLSSSRGLREAELCRAQL